MSIKEFKFKETILHVLHYKVLQHFRRLILTAHVISLHVHGVHALKMLKIINRDINRSFSDLSGRALSELCRKAREVAIAGICDMHSHLQTR